MQRLSRGGGIVVALLLVPALLLAGAPGSFRGKLVEDGRQHPNWIFVQGRNGMVRRVEISKAQVEYDEAVPDAARVKPPRRALVPGAEVRVTAEQDNDGEWRASRVEILKAAVSSQQSALSSQQSAVSNQLSAVSSEFSAFSF